MAAAGVASTSQELYDFAYARCEHVVDTVFKPESGVDMSTLAGFKINLKIYPSYSDIAGENLETLKKRGLVVETIAVDEECPLIVPMTRDNILSTIQEALEPLKAFYDAMGKLNGFQLNALILHTKITFIDSSGADLTATCDSIMFHIRKE